MKRPVALLSFEGPDRYSMVGGLGTRVTELAHAFAEAGSQIDLFFIGDPQLAPIEEAAPRVRYRRWCQWISAYHPANVYDGERGKVDDFAKSIPPVIVDEIVVPAADRGERTLVIAEEWQTSRAVIALDALLRRRGLRDAATLLWNANNTYGFESVDWASLRRAAAITTISKYMKFELAMRGQQPLIVPNGIPARLLDGADAALVARWRAALGARPAFLKVGRFDPDKRWMQAIDALALLQDVPPPPRLVVRGGREPYGEDVLARARHHGLNVEEVSAPGNDEERLFANVAACRADVIVLRAFLPNESLYALYAAASAVLANSGREPFGLVGLEVMAAGGLPVCGATGEEYAEPFINAIVVDTDSPTELAAYLRDLIADPALSSGMRVTAKQTAARFTWDAVLQTLERKLEFIEAGQGQL